MKRVLAAAMMVSLVAACTSTTDETPTSTEPTDTATTSETTTPAAPTTPEETEDETTAPTDDESAPADTIDGSGLTTDPTQSDSFPDLLGQFLPIEARVGGHGNYDRVVVEYDEDEGELSWSASYEDEPIQDGSGLPVDMAGQTFLTVVVSGVRYPDEGEATEGINVTGLNQATVVEDVHVDYPFEGMHMIFVGVDEEHPYRVQVFNDPERIVIDILHD